MYRRTIVIVDDDKDIVQAIETILTMEGFDVHHAYNGQDSFQLVQETNPELILLDYMLPDMTGKEIVAKVREFPSLQNTPIVIISAAHGLREITRDMAIQGLIEKPFELDELLGEVKRITKKTKNTPHL